MNAKARFIEGLRLLQDSVRQIDYFDTSAAVWRKKLVDGEIDFESLREVHEIKDWSRYKKDLAVELDALVRIAASEYATELSNCRKLSIALSQGFYKQGSPLVLDSITEVHALHSRLADESIDIVAFVDKLFAACKGSHADKGKAMAAKLADTQWEAYKEARGGRPIKQTIEQHFTKRSKDAATKKPK